MARFETFTVMVRIGLGIDIQTVLGTPSCYCDAFLVLVESWITTEVTQSRRPFIHVHALIVSGIVAMDLIAIVLLSISSTIE